MSTKSILFACLLALVTSHSAHAQRVFLGSAAGLLQSEIGILNNSVANLHATDGMVWVGPYLNLTEDGGQSWFVPETDSLFGTVNRLFSLDVEGMTVVAGLGRADRTGGQSVQTAAGFLISEDGGNTFSYRFPQLDGPEDDTEVYGVSVLDALPVIVPQQSPPFDIDYNGASGTIWVAGWASGIRKSDDMGRNWSRVVLPPDDLDFITPQTPYSFSVEPQRGGTGSLNHMGFSILHDAAGTVWAGTAGGLNRSVDGGLTWQKFKTDGTQGSLTGNWVISIEEQVTGGMPIIWTATWNTGDTDGQTGKFGVTFTEDGGQNFKQTLIGERIYDFAFDGAKVYAAGDNGLFISSDAGDTWDSISDFIEDSGSQRRVRPNASIFSVEYANGILWVGTSDGLLKSADQGSTWTIFHVNVPLHPEEPSDAVPDVNTYAYPNPFSRGDDVFIRIKYELDRSESVDIRVFDYGMNVIRTMNLNGVQGVNESMWDGTDDNGIQVPNGVYFYEVRSGNSRFRGKILVIE